MFNIINEISFDINSVILTIARYFNISIIFAILETYFIFICQFGGFIGIISWSFFPISLLYSLHL